MIGPSLSFGELAPSGSTSRGCAWTSVRCRRARMRSTSSVCDVTSCRSSRADRCGRSIPTRLWRGSAASGGRLRAPLDAQLQGPLHLVLAYAVRAGVIASNPADRLTSAERPKPGSGRRRFLGRDEVEQLLDAAPERYRLALACGIFSGLRLSELLGLTWKDVDFAGGTIRVRFQMGREGKRRQLKTAAARRDVILMSELGAQLRRWRLASPFSRDDDLVLCATSGRTIGHRNLTARGLEKAAKRAEIGRVNFHAPAAHVREPSSSRRGTTPSSFPASSDTPTRRSRSRSTRTCLTPSGTPPWPAIGSMPSTERFWAARDANEHFAVAPKGRSTTGVSEPRERESERASRSPQSPLGPAYAARGAWPGRAVLLSFVQTRRAGVARGRARSRSECGGGVVSRLTPLHRDITRAGLTGRPDAATARRQFWPHGRVRSEPTLPLPRRPRARPQFGETVALSPRSAAVSRS